MNRFTEDDVNIIFGLPPEYMAMEFVSIDTEWWGQTLEKLHRPHGRFACLGCTSNGRDVYMIFKTEEIQEFMDRIQDATLMGHNLQYDIRQLRKYATIPDRENIWDGYLIEQIRFSGYYDKFSLAACARRYLDIYMDKDIRDEFSEDNGQVMTDEQIFYSAVDIVATWHVGRAQMASIDEDDKSIWEHVEMPFLWVLLASGGIYFDGQAWKDRVEREKLDHEQKMEAMTINPNSSAQVKQYFLENYKVKLDSTDEKHLLALAQKKEQTAEDVQLILDARGGTKSGSTYGMKWVEAIEEDGRIYPSWKQIGAVTGRMSAEGLAVQTIPHDKEYRKCFAAEPGNTLVIKDYSAQEPRILACITQDKKLIQIFNSGKDVYISIGFEIFGEVFDKKDKRRQDMKSIILGVSYGMTFGLAAKLGVSQEEAEELLSTFFKKFPKVGAWVDRCQEWTPYATSILGRKYWGNPYKNGWERNNQNHPCQSSAVDTTKIAAAMMYQRLGYSPCKIFMHDELVCEFTPDQLEEGERVMNECMLEAQDFVQDSLVPSQLETFQGRDWSSK